MNRMLDAKYGKVRTEVGNNVIYKTFTLNGDIKYSCETSITVTELNAGHTMMSADATQPDIYKFVA